MSFSLRLTRLAEEDFEYILGYTLERWGAKKYFEYEKVLLDGFRAISEDPRCNRSKARPDLFEGAYLYPVARHYLLFTVLDETVTVERILYQGMDLARHLGDLSDF